MNGPFQNEDAQVGDTHITREVEIQSSTVYYYTPTRTTKIIKFDN